MSDYRAAAFFHAREVGFHHTPEVEQTVSYLKQTGTHIPNEPVPKIAAYLGFLADPQLANDGLITGDHDNIDYQVERAIVGEHDISESYFALQRRIARDELGLGDIMITRRVRAQMTEMVREDQRGCLKEWATYLDSDDSNYPDWFRFYTFSAITKLTEYDPGPEKFRRRSNGTAANFPELNQEVLTLVYEAINKRHIEGNPTPYPDERTERLVEGGNFAKLYTHFFNESRPSPQELEIIEGEWRRYEQTTDSSVVAELTTSLKGKGTGWCTAGEATAQEQLSGGDFFVYYSHDSEGRPTLPRVAIRLQNRQVVEVRGIEKGQNMEACMYDIVDQKLGELSGGEKWKRVAQSMQHLTAIYNSVANGNELDAHDLLFLRQYGGPIETFGYREDPRIAQLLHGRDEAQDLRLVIRHFGSTIVAQKLLDNKQYLLLAKNFEAFDAGSIDAQNLINKLGTVKTMQVIDKLPLQAIDQPAFVRGILEHGSNINYIDILLENHARFNRGVIDYAAIASRLLGVRRATWLLVKHADILPVQHVYGRLLDALFDYDFPIYNDDSPLQVEHYNKHSETVRDYWSKAIASSPNPVAIAKRFADKGSYRQPYLVTHAADFIKVMGWDEYARWLMSHKLEVLASECLQQFGSSIDHEQLAQRLFGRGELKTLTNNLQNFSEGAVNHAYLAERLLETPEGSVIILRNFRKFSPGSVDGRSLYQHLLDQKRGNAICEYIDRLTATTDIKQIVADLTARGMVSSLGVNFKSIANQYGLEAFGSFLAKNGGALLLRTRLSIFKGLLNDDEVVEGLIREGRVDIVLKNFKNFDLARYTAGQVIAEAMASGQGEKLSSKFIHLTELIPIDELQDILLSAPGGEMIFIWHATRFNLDQATYHQIIGRLCSNGHIHEIGKNIGRILDMSDHAQLARMLIENGGAAIVGRHYQRFATDSIDQAALYHGLEQAGHYRILEQVFSKGALSTVEPNAYIAHLIDQGKINQALAYMAKTPDNKIDRKAVFDNLVSRGKEDLIPAYPQLFMRFDGMVDSAKLADVLLRQGRILEVAANIQNIGAENVDTELLVRRLIEAQEVGALLKCFGVLPPGSIDPLRLVRIWSLFDAKDMTERQLSKLLEVGGAIDVAEMLMKTGAAHFIEKRLDAFLKHVKPAEFATFLEEAGFGYMLNDHEVLASARPQVENF